MVVPSLPDGMSDSFRHEALPYPGTEHFVSSAVALVREGLENDERIVVLARAAKLDDLQDALGPDGAEVTFVASDQHARNPARIAMILDNFRYGSGDRHSRGINDSFPGRSPAARAEAVFADHLLNAVPLRSWTMSLICLFDNSALDDSGQHSIRQGHGVVRGSDTNSDYDPDLAQQLYATALDPAPPSAARLVVTPGDLTTARSFVRDEVAAYGLAADRVDDLVLAVNEIVTNSLRHGGGTAYLAVWAEDGAALCEVRDRGHVKDPLTGRFAPAPSSTGGRGVWMANSLCDLVQLRSSPAGTVVRLQVDA